MDKPQTNTTGNRNTAAISRRAPDVRATGVASGQPVDMRMFPWLLPVSVAVIMVVFLVCSFFHHHRRFLQQRRHASRYFIHEYRRVAGPIFSLAATLNATPDDQGTGISGEQDDQPTSILTTNALTKRLRRCYSWSPRIFKTKHLPGLRNNPGLSAMRKCAQMNSRNSLGSIVQGLVPSSPKSPDDPMFQAKVLEEIQALQKTTGVSEEKLNAQIYALAHWASLSQSTRRKSRSLVVTTSTGALATDHGHSEPDVTRIVHPGKDDGKNTAAMPFLSEKGVGTTPNNFVSAVNAPQTITPEFLEKHHSDDGHSCRKMKEPLLFSGIQMVKSNGRAEYSQYPTSETTHRGPDTVPTIQITPTADEASAESKTTFYTPANTSQESAKQALSLTAHGSNKDWVFPIYHDVNTNIPLAPVQTSCVLRASETGNKEGHNPYCAAQDQYSVTTNTDRFNRQTSSVADKEEDPFQNLLSFSDKNLTSSENRNSDTMVPCPTAVLKDMFEICRVVRALQDILLLKSDQRKPTHTSTSKEMGGVHEGNSRHIKETTMVPKKSSEMDSSSIKKFTDRSQIRNPRDYLRINPSSDKNPEHDQNSCFHCEAVKELVESLENTNFHNIQRFLFQATPNPPSDSKEIRANSLSAPSCEETSSLPKQGNTGGKQAPRSYADDSFEVPLLLSRRRAASESSALPECQPLLAEKDNIITENVFENSCHGREYYNRQNYSRSAVIDIQDNFDAEILNTPRALRSKLEREKPNGEEEDLIGCQSLPDSPKSCDSLGGYKDSSLTSLHESMV
ncbi:hypothetical protein RRG08_029017 [Elysia crispata]|uniref:Uncharacterized protein n=2 Tax=Elysia crispata TaxID=231223 RepID=A0AAE0ZH89_9GAST|nr:hypothetical protein RRG08_029017 [Elysia crispata]